MNPDIAESTDYLHIVSTERDLRVLSPLPQRSRWRSEIDRALTLRSVLLYDDKSRYGTPMRSSKLKDVPISVNPRFPCLINIRAPGVGKKQSAISSLTFT
jgi:hypothetical protein